jgi:hypothetical protein
VVRAALAHDCGWYRYEIGPLFDATTRSTPSFMQVPLDPVQLDAFQWGTDWLTDIDAYAGLLINKHRTGLWRARYGSIHHPVVYNAKNLSPTVEAFIARNEARQKDEEKAFDAAELWTNYRLLQAWDLPSLYFCVQDPKQDHLEFIPTAYDHGGGEGARLTLTPQGEGRVSCEAYPFDVRPLPIRFVYRHLPSVTYPNQPTFRTAYYQAAPQLMSFEFV